MWVGPLEQGEGGRRRKRKFRAWRATEDTAQSKPLAQLCDLQFSPFLAHPSSGLGWTHVPVFPFPSAVKALETVCFPFLFIATPLPRALGPLMFSYSTTVGVEQPLLNTSLPPASEERSQVHLLGPARVGAK